MARILCAWELGGNYGHFAQLLPVARLLALRHEVAIALPRGFDPGPWLADASIRTFAAPPRVRPIATAGRPASYTDILRGYGFDDPLRLKGRLKPWERLLSKFRPDAVLLNAAPLASLAALRLGIPRFAIGDGFAIPPAVSPMPSFALPTASLDESPIVQAVNSLLPDSKAVEFAFELARGDRTFLATIAELDHYGPRLGEQYFGPVFDDDSGAVAKWPDDDPGVLIYLRHDTPGLDALLEAVADETIPALAHIPGADENLRKRAKRLGVALSDTPIRMRDALKGALVVACEGGHGTVAAALLSGRPLLLFPRHVEQLLTARNVVALMGAGEAVGPGQDLDAISKKLANCLRKTEIRRAAKGLGQKYGTDTSATNARSVAHAIFNALFRYRHTY